MKILDLTLPTPEENLACDEVLLDLCEQDPSAECLRFWQPSGYFIVLGYSNKVSSHVDLEACRAAGVPVYRRPSGGGTVLQGPGCLNYALALRTDARPELSSIVSANGSIMQRQREALERAAEGLPVRIQGVTDLTLEGRKISGNAQRRRARSLLFHGTFLTGLDLALVSRFLPQPPIEPEYRLKRPHADFLRCLVTPQDRIKRELALAWGASEAFGEPPAERIRSLAEARYSRADWNLKY